MKAIIKDKSQLTMQLKQFFTFDIVDENGDIVLGDQQVECTPSTAVSEIKQRVANYRTEYQKSSELEIGMEID